MANWVVYAEPPGALTTTETDRYVVGSKEAARRLVQRLTTPSTIAWAVRAGTGSDAAEHVSQEAR